MKADKDIKKIAIDFLVKTGQKAKEPIINAYQIFIFMVILIWLIISNSFVFAGTNALWNIIITISSYFFILVLRGKIGGTYSELLKSFIEILSGNTGDEEKVAKLENLLMMTAHEIGTYYEKSLEKLRVAIKAKKALKLNNNNHSG